MGKGRVSESAVGEIAKMVDEIGLSVCQQSIVNLLSKVRYGIYGQREHGKEGSLLSEIGQEVTVDLASSTLR